MQKEYDLNQYSSIGFPLNVYAFLTYFETGEFRELHYGLFNSDTDDLIEAQKNSTDLLFQYLYKSPANILEVGIGLGETHQKLMDKGFNCTGITPDSVQIEITKKALSAADLQCTRFEDFNEDSKYDIVLFQESAQYISPEDIFSKCQKVLVKTGRILIIDEFSIEVDELHEIEKFKEKAEAYGFDVTTFINLSEKARPTENYLLNGLDKYREKFINILGLNNEIIDNLIGAVHKHIEGYKNKERGYFFLELKMADSTPKCNPCVYATSRSFSSKNTS